MKVLMISGDKNLLVQGSEACARLELQRDSVEQLDVFVWPQKCSRGEIFSAAKKNNYDAITAQDPFWRGLLAWRIARKTGAKLNLQVHTNLSAQSFYRRALAYFIIRRADSVRVVSEKLKKQVETINNKIPVCVLPIFIDIGRFKNVSRQPHAQKTILWVGRFEVEKDPLQAIRILEEVRRTGVDAKLVILGTGSLEPAARQMARELPVEFPGWQADIVPYFQIADVVLCTSKHESWGASIIEALAAGIPVVAPDVGIAKEAGATIALRNELGRAIVGTLDSGKQGELKINLPNAQEWAKRWRKTLI